MEVHSVPVRSLYDEDSFLSDPSIDDDFFPIYILDEEE